MCVRAREYQVSAPCYPVGMAKKKRKTPAPTDAEAIVRYRLMDYAAREFSGQLDELESAIGMYVLGHHFGWKVLHLIHSKRTIKKYEDILRIRVTEAFDAVGPDADRARAYQIIVKASNFWKAVSGEEKYGMDRNERRSMV